jgi:hypothetical protein
VKAFAEATPAIIAEAAKSPLGIFALMVMALSLLGYFYFREAAERTRTAMFLLLLAGVASFGVATFRTTPGATPDGQAAAALAAGAPATLVPGEASTDRDRPTRLAAGEIRGRGVGEQISYYYTLDAGPGTVQVTADGQNKPSGFANAVGVEVSTLDAVPLLEFGLGNTTLEKRVVKRFDLGRRQPVIVRVLLDAATIGYLVRIEGAVDFGPTAPPKRP